MTAEQPGRPAVTVIGARGLIRDIVERTVVGAGVEVLDLTDSTESLVDVIVLIDPTDDDWTVAAEIDLPSVVVSSDKLSGNAVADAVQRGADAVIDSWFGLGHLLHAIREVATRPGSRPSSAETSGVLRALRHHSIDLRRPPQLSKEEAEVLGSLAHGDTVEEIAASLGLPCRTVKNLQSRVHLKLGVSSRRQAVERAQELGLLPQ